MSQPTAGTAWERSTSAPSSYAPLQARPAAPSKHAVLQPRAACAQPARTHRPHTLHAPLPTSTRLRPPPAAQRPRPLARAASRPSALALVQSSLCRKPQAPNTMPPGPYLVPKPGPQAHAFLGLSQLRLQRIELLVLPCPRRPARRGSGLPRSRSCCGPAWCVGACMRV